MRKRILGLAVTALSGLTAQAGERSWYASLEGGANMIDATVVGVALPTCGILGAGSCGADTSNDTGWAALGAVGTHITKSLRLEGELGYRSAGIGDNGDITNTTVMVNGLLDVPVLDNLTISVGVGAGYDWVATDQNLPTSPTVPDSSSGFAYQGLAEISFDLSDTIGLTVAYRYLDTSNADTLYADVSMHGAASDIAVASVDEASASTVTVGLRFAL